MNIYIYKNGFNAVKKSGVGQAIIHQEKMIHLMANNTLCDSFFKADIIHINTVFPDSLFISMIGKLSGKKVIYYAHSTKEDFQNSFKGSNVLSELFKLWIKICYNSGEIIITPTSYSKSVLEKYRIKKRIFALTNGVDTDFFKYSNEYRLAFRQKYSLDDNEKVVISVGHYIKRKGILDFIALAKLNPHIKFYWFGYTPLKLIPCEIQNAILNKPDNLIFPGFADANELRNAYCGCDAFVFMSNEETEGIVMLEALSCVTPIIAKNISAYNGWLKNGTNVFFANNLDEFNSLTNKLLTGQMPKVKDEERNTAIKRSISETSSKLNKIYEFLEKDTEYAR